MRENERNEMLIHIKRDIEAYLYIIYLRKLFYYGNIYNNIAATK